MASSGTNSFNPAIPVGILGALVVCGLLFVWWWFPRHYQKGVAMDMAEVDIARGEREAQAARTGVGSEAATEVGVPVYEATAHAPPKYDEEMGLGPGNNKEAGTTESRTAEPMYSPPSGPPPVTSH